MYDILWIDPVRCTNRCIILFKCLLLHITLAIILEFSFIALRKEKAHHICIFLYLQQLLFYNSEMICDKPREWQ